MLHVFYDDLKATDRSADYEDDTEELAERLSVIARRLLPSLRLYTAWLLPITNLLDGLSSDETLSGAIELFWPIYAKVIDLVAATFPIWDLEDLPEIDYMLEEDADTLGFKPLADPKNNKIWYETATGNLKARFSDVGVKRASAKGEKLLRVKDFLASGLYLANDDSQAPIKLQATRILHRDAEDVAELPMPTFGKKVVGVAPAPSSQVSKPPKIVKPLSYAAAATNGAVTAAAPAPKLNGETSTGSGSRDAQLSRMVDDLVDDDESNTPITPPQQQSADPVVVTRSDVSYATRHAAARDFAPIHEDYPHATAQKPIRSARSPATAPALRTPKDSSFNGGNTVDPMKSVSSLWDSPGPLSAQFPAGLPTGILGSPAKLYSRGHSRVNSASSMRSRTSQNLAIGMGDSWSSLDSGNRPNVPEGFGIQYPSTASPLLFGAGTSVWNTNPQPPRRVSPSNGQAG